MSLNLKETFVTRLTGEQREKIDGILLYTNFHRMRIVAISSFVVLLVFGLVPDLLFQQFGLISFQITFRHWLEYYLVMAGFLGIYTLLYYIFKPSNPTGVKPYHAVIVISFMFLFLYMAIFLSLADQYVTGTITLYIMGAIFLALVFYFPPVISTMLFLSGLLFFLMILPAYQPETIILYRHYIAAGELTVGAILASMFVYSFKCKQLDQVIRIREQHMEISYNNRLLKSNTEELQKLDQEKNELMGIMAHDLKNPLNGIKGIAELMQLDPQMDEVQMKELLGIMNTYSDRMNAIIVNLLNINAIESGKLKLVKKDVNMNRLVEEVVDSYLLASAKKGITLSFTPQEEFAMAEGDPDAIYQVLDNLVSNAIKFSPFDKKIWVEVKHQKKFIVVKVNDQGPGLNEDDKKKLFGRYAKLTARPTMNEHSTGLGLSIVQKLVTAMNGSITCKSIEGQGATFIVSLPVAKLNFQEACIKKTAAKSSPVSA